MSEDVHWQKYAARFKTYPALLPQRDERASLIVCIPVLAEPHLLTTLTSLWQCDSPGVPVEVIVLFNRNNRMSAAEHSLHDQSWKECLEWVDDHQRKEFRFLPVYVDQLPNPKGGVGWARKQVLDEAARRIHPEGIMVCLDADCTVEKNYLRVVYAYFLHHPACDAVSIYFEHRLDDIKPEEQHAIIQYELHLRYLVHAMRWAGHPFAFQTVGSSMAVRRRAYLLHGGMNTRQAGEDFYFLQKFIEIDTLHEVNETTVYPSARMSDRVPFGTGRAMKGLLQTSPVWMTTSMETFRTIRYLFEVIDKVRSFSLAKGTDPYMELRKMPGISPELIACLKNMDFFRSCQEIAQHTSSLLTFTRRFYRYFNAFRMIRYMHLMRDQFYPDVPVQHAVVDLLNEMKIPVPSDGSLADYLQCLRRIDRFET